MALWHALESCGLLWRGWLSEVATKGRRSVEKWTAVKLQVQLSSWGGGVLVVLRPLWRTPSDGRMHTNDTRVPTSVRLRCGNGCG